MGLFNNAIKSFKNSLKEDYLNIKDIKEVKKLLEEKGFKTSRIYGYKNVKRLTATNNERNRLDFIYSDKNRYIVFNYGFTNREIRSIDIVSSSKDMEEKFNTEAINTRLKKNLERLSPLHMGYKNKTEEYCLSSKEVFFTKNEIYSTVGKVSRMASINRIFNIRNIILDEEINKSKLKSIEDISGSKKLEMLERISTKVLSFIYNRSENYGYDSLWHRDKEKKYISGIFDLEFLKGSFFEEEFFLKYHYTEESFNHLFYNDFQEYILKTSEDTLLKIKEIKLKELKKDIYRYSNYRDEDQTNQDNHFKEIEEEEDIKYRKLLLDINSKFFDFIQTEREESEPRRKYSTNGISEDIPF